MKTESLQYNNKMLKNTNEITNNTTDKSDYLSPKGLLDNCANSHLLNIIIKELDSIDSQTMLTQFIQFVETVHIEVLKKYENNPVTTILDEIFQISNEILINFFAGCLKYIDQKKLDLLQILKDNLTELKTYPMPHFSTNGMDNKLNNSNISKETLKELTPYLKHYLFNISEINKNKENKIQELKLTIEDFFSIFNNISPLKHSKNNIYNVKYNEVMKMIGVLKEMNQELSRNIGFLENNYILQKKSFNKFTPKEENYFSPKERKFEQERISEIERELLDYKKSYKNLEIDYSKLLLEKENFDQHLNELHKENKVLKSKLNEINIKNTEITNKLAKYNIEYNIVKSEMKAIEQSVLNLFNKIIDISLNNMYIKLTIQKEENDMEILNETLKDKDLSRASIANNNYHLSKIEKLNLNLLLEEIQKIFEICSNKIIELKNTSKLEKRTEKSNYDFLNEISNKISEGNHSFENIFEENYKIFAKLHEDFQTFIAEEIANSSPELINSKGNSKLIDLINNYFDEVSKVFLFYEVSLNNKLQSIINLKSRTNNDIIDRRNLPPSTNNYAIHSIKEILGVRWCLLVPNNTDKSSMQQDMIWVKSTEIDEEKFDSINNDSNEKESEFLSEITELKSKINSLEENLKDYNKMSQKCSTEIKYKEDEILELNNKIESNKNEYKNLLDSFMFAIKRISNSTLLDELKHNEEFLVPDEVKKILDELINTKSAFLICENNFFSLNSKKLVNEITFRDRFDDLDMNNPDKKEINRLKNELIESNASRDKFKSLYGESVSNKNTKMQELISIMKIHVENLIYQISSSMNSKIKEIIIKILKLLEYSDDEVQEVLRKKDGKKKGFLGFFAK